MKSEKKGFPERVKEVFGTKPKLAEKPPEEKPKNK